MILNIQHRNKPPHQRNWCGGKPIKGTISLPGDKSIAQRAIILAAIAEGQSILRNVSLSDDCLAVIRCIRQLGVEVKVNEIASPSARNDKKAKGTGVVTIKGKGLYGLRKPSKPLNVGESGTAARLLTGLLVGQRFPSVITGKKTLLSRPMKRVIEPLCLMGAKIKSKEGRLPICILPNSNDFIKSPHPPFAKGEKGGLELRNDETSGFRRMLKGISYTMSVASAQVKSAILLAGLYADGQTVIKEPIPTRDHTERLLNMCLLAPKRHGALMALSGKSLKPVNIEIPGDFSSAAYFIAAGLLVPGSKIIIRDVGLNPYRIGLLTVLKRMGARVSQISNRKSQIANPEPIGDITVKYSQLKGITVSKGIIPSLIDEIPILALIATQAKGTTIIKGAGELRVKESDRIKAIVTELAKLGADISETPNGMIIKGPTKLRGAVCSSHNDHRMAMTLAIAGLVARGKMRIKGAEVINKSFPSFMNYNIITENTNTNHTNRRESRE